MPLNTVDSRFTVGITFPSLCRGRMHVKCNMVYRCARTSYTVHNLEIERLRRWPVCMAFAPHCRAGDFARRTNDFLIFIMCGGVCARRRVSEANRRAAAALRPKIKTPPYRGGETGNQPGTPRDRSPLPGGIYASPTNEGAAYASQKRYHKATVHGGRERPPYRAGETGNKPRPPRERPANRGRPAAPTTATKQPKTPKPNNKIHQGNRTGSGSFSRSRLRCRKGPYHGPAAQTQTARLC